MTSKSMNPPLTGDRDAKYSAADVMTMLRLKLRLVTNHNPIDIKINIIICNSLIFTSLKKQKLIDQFMIKLDLKNE